MAKSSRSSTKKANNQRLAATVFGPAESARAERLSAKLLALAKQPKPEADINMDDEPEAEAEEEQGSTKMDVDSARSKPRGIRKRIDKRKQKKASIVFPKYSDRVKAKNKKKAAGKSA
ncbi:major facilitator super transporter protein [Lecanicillium sp. MT-2017a]|nr:major facilitator super transporter protein [Lecanicillium sp. MT-2017a]